MALTRPTFQNLNSNNVSFNDSLTVTNFANVANRDIGQIFDRSQASQPNVAIIWSEATSSIRLGYTTSSGQTTGNVVITSNADLILGNLTSSGLQTVGGNLIVQSVTNSNSTVSGALIVAGGVGISGNVFVGNLFSNNLYYANGAILSQSITLTGDITAVGTTGSNIVTTLSNTGVIAGTYGNATSIPTVAVDSKGRITSISANTVSTTISLAGDSGSGSVSGGGTLTVNGTANQITTAISGSTYTLSLPLDLTTPGNVVITGNLTVNGNSTIINANTITTNDKNITLANNQSTGALVDGAGIDIGNNSLVTWRYNNATTSWQSNVGITPTSNATLGMGGTSNYWGTGYFNAVQAPSITGVLQTAAQTNVTSLGTLTGLTLSGTLNGTALQAATIGNSGATLTGILSNAAQPNVTSLGTLTSLTLSGTLTGTTINAATIGNIGSSVTGTLQTAAQTNITSVGTLTGLTLSGTLNGTTLQAATIGNTSAIFTGATYTASSSFNGPLNGTLGSAGGNTAIVSTLSTTGNATVNALTVNNSTTIGGTLGVTGNATASNLSLSGSLTTQNLTIYGGLQNTPIGNVTASSGTFTSLSASGTFTGTTINAATIGNVNATLTGILSTAAQNNITSVGTLTGLTLSGTLNGTTLQATTIGNTGAAITGATVTASETVNGPHNGTLGSAGGNTAIVSTLSATGNVTINALTVNNSATIPTLGILGNATIGNVLSNNYYFANGAPFVSSAPGGTTGQFQYNTATSFGGSTYFNYVSGNGQIIANAGINSTSVGTGTLLVTGGIGVSGNVTSANLTTGNITATGALTVTSLTLTGGIQNTPVGNATPSTGNFTSLNSSSNVTVNALTINNSATIGTTLGVVGTLTGTTINAATIGNASAALTGSTVTASGTINGPLNGTLGSAGGNTAIVSTLSTTGNTTVNALSVNNSVTVGSTLSATAGIQNTIIGNATAAAGYFTTINSTGAASFSSLSANAASVFYSNVTITGNLIVSGNVISTGSNNTFFTDSILELHTLPNLANLTVDDGKDIGLRLHYYKTQDAAAFLGWDNQTGFLEWFGSGVDESASANITGVYGTIRSGAVLLVNNTPTTGNATGALQVSGGISTGGNVYAILTGTFEGGLQNTSIGNVNGLASTGSFTTITTTGNVTASALTVNNSATVGGTLGVVGTLTGTTINAATIGNASAALIGATVTASGTINGPLNGTLGSAGGNTAIVSTLSATGNITVSALSVNNSATIPTLGISGNATIGNVLSNNYYFANGALFVSSVPGGTTGQFQYNTSTNFGGSSYFNYVSGNGQIIANAGISSTSTGTGTMLATGGVGVTGNIYAGNYFYANGIAVGSTPFTVIIANTQTGDNTTTAFTVPVGNATTAGTIVAINGVLQQTTTAYSVTSANATASIFTFTEAPTVTDVIDFRVITTTTIAETSVNSGTATFVTANTQSNITAVGTLTSITTSGAIINNGSSVTVGTGGGTMDSWSGSTYKAAKYVVTARDSGSTTWTALEALVVTNGSANAAIITYNTVNAGTSGTPQVSLSASATGGNVTVTATGAATGTVVNFSKNYIVGS